MTGGGREAARQLLMFARTEFGEHLCALLLSGYGEERRTLVRPYEVTIRDGAREVKKRLKLVTDDPSGLPSQDEPLILLALLRLLWIGGQERTSDVSYAHERLLRVLDWPDTGQARAGIDHAIERYFNLALAKEEAVEVSLDEELVTRLTSQRMVIGYDYAEEVEDEEEELSEEGRVIFNPDFIEGLQAQSLLNINWNLVTSITPTTY